MPSNHGVLGKTSNNSPASSFLSGCPKSQCFTDAISCLANAGEKPNDKSKSNKSSDQFSLGTDLPKLNLVILLVNYFCRLKVQTFVFELKAICFTVEPL